jgi:hypothetical protein
MNKYSYYEVGSETMAHDERPRYEDRDVRIIGSHIFHELCLRDAQDRAALKPSASHDLRELSKRLRAYHNNEDVIRIAEDYLVEELKFIERDSRSFQVKLTEKGRENCRKGIEIPPSERAIAQNPSVFDRLAEL